MHFETCCRDLDLIHTKDANTSLDLDALREEMASLKSYVITETTSVHNDVASISSKVDEAHTQHATTLTTLGKDVTSLEVRFTRRRFSCGRCRLTCRPCWDSSESSRLQLGVK
jgi:hypothetical protein